MLRIEIADAQTGEVVVEAPVGHNPRWRLISALTAESPDGVQRDYTDQGYRIDYLPANRGQLDAATNYVALSDLQTTRVGPLPSINRWLYTSARDPRLSPQLDYICLRSPQTGDLRLLDMGTGAAAPAMGAGDEARWAVDGSLIVWGWAGRVYGRAGALAPTVDLTPPGRHASHAVPLHDRTTGQFYVGLVLASTGDTGDLVVVRYSAQPMAGWIVGQSGGSAFDWDLFSDGDGAIRAVYASPQGAPVRTRIELSRPTVPITSVWPPVVPVTPSQPRILAWFYSHGRYGDYAPPATASVLTVDNYSNNGVIPPDAISRLCNALRAETGFISLADLSYLPVRDHWAYVRGVIGAHEPSTAADAKAAVTAARQTIAMHGLPPRPVIAVITVGQALDPGYRQTGADVVAAEIYFDDPSPTYADMLARVHRTLDEVQFALSGVPLYLIPQAYDRSKGSWQQHPTQLAAIEEACASRLNDPQVLGLWPFAYARPGGATTYPELAAIYAAQGAVMVAPPLPVDPPKPDPPDPQPPAGDDMTHDDMRRYIAELQNNVLFGAYQRFHNEVLPRDRPMDGAIKSAAWTSGDLDFWTGDVTTGGASAIFNRVYIVEYCIARDKGRTMEQASGDGYDAAKRSYDQAVGNPQ